MLLVSALKTVREQLYKRGVRWQNRIELALTASDQLVHTIDPTSGRTDWGSDVVFIFRHEPAGVVPVSTVLQLVHPDDRDALRVR